MGTVARQRRAAHRRTCAWTAQEIEGARAQGSRGGPEEAKAEGVAADAWDAAVAEGNPRELREVDQAATPEDAVGPRRRAPGINLSRKRQTIPVTHPLPHVA